MQSWIEKAEAIQPAETIWRQKARARLKEQIRPEKSLGMLELLIEQLAAIQKQERLNLNPKKILIFAADHGVAEEQVSAYPSDVTRAMVLNFLDEGATINVLARHVQAEVAVIDVGVNADFNGHSRLVHEKVAFGTKNMTLAPAMTQAELEQALRAGWGQIEEAHADSVRLVALGEMGIGNTTAASAVASALLKCPAEEVTGCGTGLSESERLHKAAVIQKALEVHHKQLTDPLNVMRSVGGLELAALLGAVLGACHHQIPVVIDGWIVGASALAAVRLNPNVKDYLFFAHRSGERGHARLLDALQVQPILDLGMRLGEGSGAALAMGILEACARVFNETATFEEAGVRRRVL